MEKLVVHIILNSHLDPIWLWDMSQGIDEVLATSRSACDVLDDYPQAHVTRGEAWFYEMVEKHAPDTFRRIQKHVAEGRWHVVGNWYVQPDCNLASPETYRKHAEISSAYFREKFGIQQVQTGYNVDSFGHSAYLPDFYAGAGVKNYIFMRPSPVEKTNLPAETFIWRAPGGGEVLTSRIRTAYTTNIATVQRRLEEAIEHADRRIGHTMCFVGMGDHGCGPAREEVEWFIAHQNDYPGVEIRFSHPDAFFDCVRESKAALPVVQDELQHHAIGCYSAIHRIKQEVRMTENLLLQAAPHLTKQQHDEAWRRLLFCTFHDVLAGSCIKSAYQTVYDMLAYSRTIATDAITAAIRQKSAPMPPCPLQRVILDNVGDKPFGGIFEVPPFLPYPVLARHIPWNTIRVLDEDKTPVTHQMITPEAAAGARPHFAIQTDIPPRGRRVFYIDYNNTPSDTPAQLDETPLTLESLPCGKKNLLAEPIAFKVLKDTSDTWSHRLKCFSGRVLRTFKLERPFSLLQNGPLFRESIGRFVDSRRNTVTAVVRQEAGLNGLHIRLRVQWQGAQELLKLVLKPAFQVIRREDGVTGGPLQRKMDGEEWPMFNYCLLKGRKDAIAFISADCTSCDVQPDGTLQITLLRAPYFAHHEPFAVPKISKFPVTDQGEHEYDIVLLANPAAEDIQSQIYRQTNPVRFADSTFGVNRTWYGREEMFRMEGIILERTPHPGEKQTGDAPQR